MYLSNKELYVEIIISKAQGKLTRRAEKMIELLAKKMLTTKRYYDQDDKLDCYQTALLDLYSNWYNFNEEKSRNTFAYFTEIFKRGLMKGYNEIYTRKGSDEKYPSKTFSIDNINDGNGMFNI